MISERELILRADFSSSEMDNEIYVNVEKAKSANFRPSTSPTGSGPSRSERGLCAVVVFLSLLSVFLLAALIGLGVLYDESSKRSSSELRANLTELLRISEGKLSSLTEERDQLNVSLSEITEECSRLQGWRRRKNCCPAGWKKFGHFCLLLSNETGSWDEGRKDCRARGADLVVIDSPEKQGFLISMSTTETIAWIGLTDRVEEGNWTWINGAPLSEGYWKRSQPDNGGQPRSKTMQEDCAHLTVGLTITNNWNDLPCEWIQKWICEQSSKCDQDGRDGVQMKA